MILRLSGLLELLLAYEEEIESARWTVIQTNYKGNN